MLLWVLAILVPVAVIAAMIALFRVLAAQEIPDDVGSARAPTSLIGRFRAWLTSTPKKLDYRRDKKGRFRRVRRG